MPANIKRIVSKQVTIKLNMSDTVTPSIGKKKRDKYQRIMCLCKKFFEISQKHFISLFAKSRSYFITQY